MKCFYHSADLDGHCSGAIVKMQFPECEMIGINYGDEFPWESIYHGEVVFMVDFTLQPFSDMKKLNCRSMLTWINHHKTSIDEATREGFLALGGQRLEIGKAGCELTWEWMFPDRAMPTAVWFLGRYDVWQHQESAYILPFQYGMRQFEDTTPNNTALWQELFSDNQSAVMPIVCTGETILNYESKQNAKFCKGFAFETELNGFTAICANRGFSNSKLFDSVYDESKHHLMIQFSRQFGVWNVSLYSTRQDVDCGIIAKSYRGGGHKGAAGFQCQELPFKV